LGGSSFHPGSIEQSNTVAKPWQLRTLPGQRSKQFPAGVAPGPRRQSSTDDIADTIRNIGKSTTIAEREMHATPLVRSRAPSDARGDPGTKVGVALISCTINDTPPIGHIAHRARTGAAEK
jgi:hypothetical protein